MLTDRRTDEWKLARLSCPAKAGATKIGVVGLKRSEKDQRDNLITSVL